MLGQVRQLTLFAALLLAACTKDEAPARPPPTTAHPQAAGSSAEAPEYSVALSASGPIKAGAPAAAAFTITAKGTFHVNADYPLAFSPGGQENARFEGDRVRLQTTGKTPCAAHTEDICAVEVPLPFTAEKPGPTTVAGTLAFSVCDPERCLIQKVPLAVSVAAE
jgi:hypothetical protein